MHMHARMIVHAHSASGPVNQSVSFIVRGDARRKEALRVCVRVVWCDVVWWGR